MERDYSERMPLVAVVVVEPAVVWVDPTMMTIEMDVVVD